MNKKDPWSKRKNLYSSPIPKMVKKPKIKWRIFPILWIALKKTCMLIGAVVLMFSIIMSWSLSSIIDEIAPKPLPNQMVLYMELDGEIGDIPKEASLADPFVDNDKTVKSFIDEIERAKNDPRVMGIYARVKPARYSLAHIQEIRTAIADFKTSGKFTYIYSSSYGNGLGGYYLASIFDEIWMQPMGSVMITGMNAEMPFLRNILDKAGIEPQFFHRKEYKTAYESLTNSEMSDANREAITVLISDIAQVITADISSDRDISKSKFKNLVDKGVLLSGEALDAGLIDKADYADNLIEHINKKVTGNPKSPNLTYVNFDDYMVELTGGGNILLAEVFDNAPKEKTSPHIALIYAVGAIMDSKDNKASTSLMGGSIAAADDIAGALITAAYDENIDGVVLRVDSPGGSPVASETILRAVRKVQEKGKSVTVSMGATAASGGYWISAYADQIFVLPTTITGSIGVLGGKISAQKLWENLGINWDGVKWGENAAMFSMNTPFSESEAERMNAMLDNIYDNFVERVSKGRKMSVPEVDKIARGRVWLGTQAVKIGLADQFGGLNEALDYAAVKAGAKGRKDIEVVILPKPLSAVEKFIEMLENQVTAGKIMGIQASILKELQPFISQFMIMQDVGNNSVYNPVNVK